MLPGKKYAPEDFLKILRQRFWWLIVPLAVVSAATALVARRLPDVYSSETVILVVPQRVPSEYVRSTITTPIEDRLQTVGQQILSRTRLEQIIREFDLYLEDRQAGIPMEDIVLAMRDDIAVNVVRGDAFQIRYQGADPMVVMRVTDRLASLFVDENLRDRGVLAEGTNQFLEAQLTEARRQLVETERRLEAYRRQYAGELPSQLDSNIQQVMNAQMQIQQIAEALNRDQERQLEYERQLALIEATPAEQLPARPSAPDAPAGSTSQQLTTARAELERLALRFKAGHPDLERARRQVRDLEQRLGEELRGAPNATTGDTAQLSPAELDRRRRLSELKTQLAELSRQMEQKQRDRDRLRERAELFQRNADAVPTRESELTELTRDYATLQDLYTGLLQKKEESRIAANLERRQVGEQFKVLDPARVAERPFSPNRERINLMGMAGGLAVGVLLIGMLEYKDDSLKTDDEVTNVLGLPVMAVVPMMHSVQDHQRLMRKRWVMHLGLASTVMLCIAVTAYAYLR